MKKIFNDPVYGFITISNKLVNQLIEHSYFQRLRRIKQLGLTYYVYPGATHNRFQHALGAVHLTNLAIDILRSKGYIITEEESEAVMAAVLLHDIGHGPFSHALESSLVKDIGHEYLSKIFMERLNKSFKGRLTLAINIFSDQYSKGFLHHLISSQLDVDRMDYLNRDSFFTGVHEGVIGYDRIIKMLAISGDDLVVEAKGIYSIEKFIIARRLMYWQVYLHKTVLVAEQMLEKILQRAKELAHNGIELFCTPSLHPFLYNEISKEEFNKKANLLKSFSNMDDFDIFTSLKVWAEHEDIILSTLCSAIINRRLFKIELQNGSIEADKINVLTGKTMKRYNVDKKEAAYLVFCGSTSNSAYSKQGNKINILDKKGNLKDIAIASDQLNISVLSEPVVKNYVCYPKDI